MGLDVAILTGKAGSPDPELAGADQIEIAERIGEPTTFRLRYPLAVKEGDFPLLRDGRLDPGSELHVVAPVGGVQHRLVRGQIYGQKLHMQHGAAGSWVEAIGGDVTLEMDREIKAKVWDKVSVADAVTAILGGYGVTPDVESLSTRHDEDNHTLVQRDTDLKFLRRLARRYGCWLWITTAATGISTAHFRRPPLGGSPTATLKIHIDGANLGSLDLEWDVERPTAAVAAQLGLRDKQTLAGDVSRSPLAPLGSKAFADVAAARGVQVMAPVDDAGDLRARAEAALIDGGWFIRARGETNARSLGSVLRAHTVVAVDGMGKRHSGKYLVASVRHRIDAAAHVMEFTLARNGWEA
jgi:phage protein D